MFRMDLAERAGAAGSGASDASAASPAARIVANAFRGYAGSIELRLWDGSSLRFGSGPTRATIRFRDPRALRDLVLFRDPLRLARDYLRGRIDVDGSIYEAIALRDHIDGASLTPGEKFAAVAWALRTGERRTGGNPRVAAGHAGAAASDVQRHNSRDSIAFHYDVSNAFYALWLDPQMVYSCAYFADPGESLQRAQRRKLDLVCRKLCLAPGQRLLDIGCGWGALAIRAAQCYGVRAHGITLSRQQLDFARARIEALGLGDRVTVELRDYRDLAGEAAYDKIASIGMFEHVGLANLPAYFSAARCLLKPGGLFLNHGITSREGGWEPNVYTRFINRYVFPDGELDSVASIQRVMESCDFEILDVQALRPHYALTLRRWVDRLEAHRDDAVREVGEAAYRVWQLYMAGCALNFEQGETGVYQILLSAARGAWSAPLTRGHVEPSG
jgi:cyclopropane-fatty-acyl-phospholipid synthase